MKPERLADIKDRFRDPIGINWMNSEGRVIALDMLVDELVKALEAEQERSRKLVNLIEDLKSYLPCLPWYKSSEMESRLKELRLPEMVKILESKFE
jgi:hypothetical protein